MEWAIEAEDLVKQYGMTMALDCLSLKVKKGEFFGFLGPNGAGKTTFVKILLNLCFPTKGNARILGQDIRNPSARKHVGFLPENIHVHPFLTIEEFMRFHARLLGMGKAQGDSDSKRLLEMTGMYDNRKKQMGALSKGMKQRVGIAQALLGDPELMILDEPTSGLDPIGIKEIRDILLDVKSNGTTVFLNSHLLSEIEKTCDSVAILNKGRIVKIGDTSDFSDKDTYLEVNARGLTEEMIQEIQNISSGEISYNGGDLLNVYLENEEDSIKIHEIILKHGGRLISLAWKGESLEDVFYRLVTEDEQ